MVPVDASRLSESSMNPDLATHCFESFAVRIEIGG